MQRRDFLTKAAASAATGGGFPSVNMPVVNGNQGLATGLGTLAYLLQGAAGNQQQGTTAMSANSGANTAYGQNGIQYDPQNGMSAYV